jgi:peptidoglycan-N-acetylglucosamine deacetylase
MRYQCLCLAVLGSLLCVGPASAAGPTHMARSDRSLWPEAIDSAAAFDRASRAEILSFVAALAETQGLDPASLAGVLGVKNLNAQSVAWWRGETTERLSQSFRLASAHCRKGDWLCDPGTTSAGLAAAGAAFDGGLPQKFQAWRENARAFHRAYALEQLRLAALFPHPTSEIRTFSDHERNGFELEDRRFLLTFDDGPSPQGGSSDALVGVLRGANRNGVFFMLGERLDARLLKEPAETLRADFAGMCVASHGWSHKSHQSAPDWQKSITDTAQLVQSTFGPLYRPLFRPPYGQRKADSGAFFQQERIKVALWNIDSQDWSAQLTAAETESRVISLMLLWRRGVILFHDVHDKARQILPRLWSQTDRNGVIWADCREEPQQ